MLLTTIIGVFDPLPSEKMGCYISLAINSWLKEKIIIFRNKIANPNNYY
jgi:hypothetical protein